MASDLWFELPSGFLKGGRRYWRRQSQAVKCTIVELARSQNFKCPFCPARNDLIVEHEHWPEYRRPDLSLGVWQYFRPDSYSEFNIRGLTCSKCNTQIDIFERNEIASQGAYFDARPRLSSSNYGRYIAAYHKRVEPLIEQALDNYWRRELILNKFDDWHDWGRRYGFRQAFNVRVRRYRKIKSPQQLFAAVNGVLRFCLAEFNRDPNYAAPEELIELMLSLQPLMDRLRPANEAER